MIVVEVMMDAQEVMPICKENTVITDAKFSAEENPRPKTTPNSLAPSDPKAVWTGKQHQ